MPLCHRSTLCATVERCRTVYNVSTGSICSIFPALDCRILAHLPREAAASFLRGVLGGIGPAIHSFLLLKLHDLPAFGFRL